VFRLRRPRSPVHALRQSLAVALAVLAAVLALRPQPATHTGSPPRVSVTVAASDLLPGSALAATDLRTARFPTALVPRGTTPVAARLVGRVLAAAVRAGEPVTDVRLVDAGLTRLLSPGQVAAPVRPADLAVSGLVRAGDRVDVLASRGDSERAELVAGAALVLASLTPGDRRSAEAEARSGSDGLLVLAVDGPTAARLAAAAATSTLSVTLAPP